MSDHTHPTLDALVTALTNAAEDNRGNDRLCAEAATKIAGLRLNLRLTQKWLDRLREERDQLKAGMIKTYLLPGDMQWLAEDPEEPLECWSSPIMERWGYLGDVFEIRAAVSLPNIFVAERVLTVDEDGDPFDTEAAWFLNSEAATACYPESLAAARAALAENEDRHP